MIPNSTTTRRNRRARTTDQTDDPALPGLAPERGLTFWRDPADYRRYLRKFACHYADGATLVDLGDPPGARQYARTLKGIAASLGLPEVATAARRLELALGTEQPTATEAAAEAQDALQTALAVAFYSIARYAPDAPVVNVNCSADRLIFRPRGPLGTDPADSDHLSWLLRELAPPPGD